MTDINKLKQLFDNFGIEYKIDDSGDSNSIECHTGSPNVNGYWGFFTYFEFTKEGKFKEMGAAE